TVRLTVRGELVEPPAAHPEPFDKLSRNSSFVIIKSISYDFVALRNAIQNWTEQHRNVLRQAQDERAGAALFLAK
ncbi:MAG: hypothetical protein Q7J20_06630, partial [Candidatus Nitrotoga sp.]|nr:hypothetical protein [Candidatus Nitrotoga sp.]